MDFVAMNLVHNVPFRQLRWNCGRTEHNFFGSAGTIAKSNPNSSPSMTDNMDPYRFDKPIKTIAIIGAGDSMLKLIF